MKTKSIAIKSGNLHRLNVSLTRKDLAKVFAVVCAAELAMHFPVRKGGWLYEKVYNNQ